MAINRVILLVCIIVLIFLCGKAASQDEKIITLFEKINLLNFCEEIK
jgi:hypothetical protein